MKPHNIIRLVLIFLTTQLLGCSYQGELERVAKDWCMTIRASQVIPVYPLTEDLEPGDVFLVQIPLSRQVEQYKQKGFLEFDMHLARLSIPKSDFNEFYNSFYGLSDQPPPLPPHIWQQPLDSNVVSPNQPGKDRHLYPTYWYKAPHAAFPTYTFEVQRAGAFQAALPISGIPVALGLLAADKATGSVTIKDSYTYGLPYDKLVQRVVSWADQNQPFLKNIRASIVEAEPFSDRLWRAIAGPHERTIYLRIISRVYLSGSMTVSVTNTSAGIIKAATQNFGEKAGGLPDFNDVNDYTRRLQKLNDSFKLQYPDVNEGFRGFGGSLNLAWATFRSVGIDERFDRPLVIGYLAFDFPVLEEGQLGIPVATLHQLSGSPVPKKLTPLPSTSSLILTGLLSHIEDGLRRIATDSSDSDRAYIANTHIRRLNEAAARILRPGTFYLPCTYQFDIRKPLLTEECGNAYEVTPNLDDLIALLAEYKNSTWALNEGIKRIKVGQQLSIKYHDRTTPLVEKPNETDLKKLTQKYDEYKSKWNELDSRVRSAPEIYEAVEYYKSLFSTN
jgi:hypothetical protein